jgi:hypothetical protein
VKLAIGIVCAYALIFATWALYLAAMNLKAHLATMGPVAKVHGYALVAVAITFDAFVNLAICTLLFADRPREWLLTARLKRYRRGEQYAGTWRARLAEWICSRLLDQFDPRGEHC